MASLTDAFSHMDIDEVPADAKDTDLEDHLKYHFFRDGADEEIPRSDLIIPASDQARLTRYVESTFLATTHLTAETSQLVVQHRPHLCAALHRALPGFLGCVRADTAFYTKLIVGRPGLVNAMVDWLFSRTTVDEVGLLEQRMGDCACFEQAQWSSKADRKLLRRLHSGPLFGQDHPDPTFSTFRIITSIANELFFFLGCITLQMDDRKLFKVSERRSAKNEGYRRLSDYFWEEADKLVLACACWYTRFAVGNALAFLERYNSILPEIFQPNLVSLCPRLLSIVITFLSTTLDIMKEQETLRMPDSVRESFFQAGARFLCHITARNEYIPVPGIREKLLWANGDEALFNNLVRLVGSLASLPSEEIRLLSDKPQIPESLGVAARNLREWFTDGRPDDAPPLLWHEAIDEWGEITLDGMSTCMHLSYLMHSLRKCRKCMNPGCGKFPDIAAKPYHLCSRCHIFKYCSKDCQHIAWKRSDSPELAHQRICSKLGNLSFVWPAWMQWKDTFVELFAGVQVPKHKVLSRASIIAEMNPYQILAFDLRVMRFQQAKTAEVMQGVMEEMLMERVGSLDLGYTPEKMKELLRRVQVVMRPLGERPDELWDLDYDMYGMEDV